MTAALTSSPWYLTRRFQLTALAVLGLALLVEGYLAVVIRDNDFLVHRRFGEAFLNGQPLHAGQSHYLLSRGMMNGLTAWLPYFTHRALHFGAAVGAFILTLVWWHRITAAGRPELSRPGLAFAAGVFTLVLVGCYVQRDLDDCGLQLFLLFFLTAALYALWRGSALGCGFWLGLATAYKVTPVIFLPYLIWKREFRAAGWMAAFFVLFNLAPAVYLGWETTRHYHVYWLKWSASCLASADPSVNPLEPPRHLNQGLQMAVARFLQTYPPGHRLHLEHPTFVQFGDFEPHQAKRGVQFVILTLGVALAWRFRRRHSLPAQGAGLAHEWAAATALCAILSPLCWLQHLSLVVPCVFLWMQSWLAGLPRPRWHGLVMGTAALFVLGVHREFVSKPVYEVLVSYKLHTIAALLTVLLVLTLPEEEAGAMQTETAGVEPAVRQAA